jgi:hypothetical protein
MVEKMQDYGLIYIPDVCGLLKLPVELYHMKDRNCNLPASLSIPNFPQKIEQQFCCALHDLGVPSSSYQQSEAAAEPIHPCIKP